MKFILQTFFIIVLFGTFSPLHANPAKEVPDLVGCLKGVEALDWRYRPKMQSNCIDTAADICLADDENGGQCMSGLVTSIRQYHERLMPLLPEEIDGNYVRRESYKRSLQRIRETFRDVSDCNEVTGYNKTICETVRLTVNLTDLMYRAREAGIDLP